jgi:hypothetical protein
MKTNNPLNLFGGAKGDRTPDLSMRPLSLKGEEDFGGAEGDRTPDLMNAIHALSQLSYSPTSQVLESK